MESNKIDRRQRLYEVIEIGNQGDKQSRIFDYFITATILLNIAVLFLQTFDSLAQWLPLFETIETITMTIFVVEYLLRIWTADRRYPEVSRSKAIWKYVTSFDGIIELLTILPFFFLSGFVVFRMLRVVRIFHLFRINTNIDSLNVITTVIYEKRNQLASSFFIIFVLMVSSSLCMYSAEHTVQPDAFQNALSGIWWSMSAVLTVGYGDIYPITTAGKIIGIVISFLGVCAVAVPTGIISAGFVEQYRKAEIDPSSLETAINTVIIDIDSRWLGKTIAEAESESGYQLVILKRGDSILKPSPNTKLELKDQLLVFESKHH